MQSDALLIVATVGRKEIYSSPLSCLIEEVKYWASTLQEVRFAFVPRRCNQMTHRLARFALGIARFVV